MPLERGVVAAHDQPVQRGSVIVRAIWAACLLVAGLNHARTLFQHGLLWDYGGVGWPSATYWSSLTLLDPIVAALLFVRPVAGVRATLVLIATNVAHNLAIPARYAPEGEFLTRISNPFFISQVGFMLFAAATAHLALRHPKAGREAKST